jgi:hypothetical protein
MSDNVNGSGIVEVNSNEYEELKDYLIKSHGYTHQYEILLEIAALATN